MVSLGIRFITVVKTFLSHSANFPVTRDKKVSVVYFWFRNSVLVDSRQARQLKPPPPPAGGCCRPPWWPCESRGPPFARLVQGKCPGGGALHPRQWQRSENEQRKQSRPRQGIDREKERVRSLEDPESCADDCSRYRHFLTLLPPLLLAAHLTQLVAGDGKL